MPVNPPTEGTSIETLRADNEILARQLIAAKNRIEDDMHSAEKQLRDIVSLRERLRVCRRDWRVMAVAVLVLTFALVMS